MGSNQLKLAEEYGQAARITVHGSIKRDWYLFEEERQLLDKWYVLRWSGQFFAGKCSHFPNHGMSQITHDGVNYVVYYHRSSYKDCEGAKQVMVSFRRIHGAALGIALVRTVKEKGERKYD